MLIQRAPDVRSSEITDERHYRSRREFVRAAAGGALAVGALMETLPAMAATPAAHGRRLSGVQKSPLSVADEALNTWDQITTYNNFYEFGTDKDAPSEYSRNFKTQPWTVAVEGECNKKAVY